MESHVCEVGQILLLCTALSCVRSGGKPNPEFLIEGEQVLSHQLSKLLLPIGPSQQVYQLVQSRHFAEGAARDVRVAG